MTDTVPTIEISDPAALPSKPLVSVTMLAYRHEKFIAEAIEGVIAQQCDFAFELIIGEDCSPDRTREIVLDYQRRYPHLIRVLIAEKNVGMHANGKRCLDAARGEFLAPCEGDDYWHHPRKLQMQIATMLTNQNISLCHTDYDRQIGSRIKKDVNRTSGSKPATSYLEALRGNTIKTATSIYPKELVSEFARSEFSNPQWPFGDHNLELFMTVKGEIAYMDVSTAVSRKVAGSATNSGADRALKMAVAGLECRELFLKKFQLSDVETKSVLLISNRSILRGAICACNEKTYKAAFGRLIELGEPPSKIHRFWHLLALRLKFPIWIYAAYRSAFIRYKYWLDIDKFYA